MTLYELLLIVPALLLLIAFGMVVMSFIQYKPSEVFGAVGRWLRAHAMMLGIYLFVIILLAVFVL